ncbi:MAG: hypoxanthine phosphoribosyltransferase [Rikenellaceae bacterium]
MTNNSLPNCKTEVLFTHDEILEAVAKVAARINRDYQEVECPILLGVLNGSYAFIGDLLKNVHFECEICFIKLASYIDNASSGTVRELVGLNCEVKGRHVIIIEDIVDTGTTVAHLVEMLKELGVASSKVCTLFYKPECCREDLKIDYHALELGDQYIFGYGLDYNQRYRNLNEIYAIINE